MTDERANPPGSDEPAPGGATPPPPGYPYGPPPGPYPGAYPPVPPPYGGYGYPMPPTARGPANGLGIAALVTAIIGLLSFWTVLGGLVLGIVAVVLGFVARGRCKRGEADNIGVATTGIVLGFIAMALSVVFTVIMVTAGVRWFDDVGGSDYVRCMQRAGDDHIAQQRCEEDFQRRVEDSFGVTPTPTP
ncbi:DUF4190 domain-containing protein [Mycobacterium sp. TNTM28]|uniref:DUF4190 domain-containing protein n=1 Tax=[Mycobacterium] fortunisiensis TaxID=2600579 RepID=A0ABS6KN64_9MYCO|nr:DUF4190 domain-containing protein [[Mycobacterium] fortunisiensis]MBU9765048.1 DUF4190 domain-containing protein [[Mycobacterium] fortunisiensis]